MGLGTRPGSQWTLKVRSRMTGSEGLQAAEIHRRGHREAAGGGQWAANVSFVGLTMKAER